MKSERRHELQKNELADWLGEQVNAIKPHAGLISICVVGALLILLVGASYFGSEGSAAAKNWSDYFSAYNQREPVKVLEQLAQRKGTPAALWALQSTGDMHLAQGAGLLFSDRTEAKVALEKAEKAYEQVVKEASDPILRTRAELGLGKVYESLCDPEKAALHYTRAAEVQKNSAISKVAAEAAARMKDERQIALLAWFVKQEPKRPAALPGVGGAPPGMPGSVPDRPDIAPPSGLNLGHIGAETPADPKAAAATDPKAETPKTETPKIENPPSEQPKAESTKTETPAPAAP